MYNHMYTFLSQITAHGTFSRTAELLFNLDEALLQERSVAL